MNKDDINKLFDKLKPSKEKKDEIYSEIIEAKNNERSQEYPIKKNETKKRKFKTVFVLSLILLFSITVYAVSNIPENFSSKIKNFSLSEDATNINVSDTDKGYKITAESIFGDKKFVYTLLSVEREDGKKLRNLGNMASDKFWIRVKDKSIEKDNLEYFIGTTRNYSLDTGFTTIDKEYFLQVHNIEMEEGKGESMIGGHLHLEIDRISLGLLGFGTKGDWELDIPLEYKDLSQTYKINKEFNYKNKKISLDKIHFSDLNAAIYFKSKDGGLVAFTEEIYDIKFKLKDGTLVNAEWDTGAGDNKGTHYYYAISLVESGKIDPKEISAILLADIEIPVDLR